MNRKHFMRMLVAGVSMAGLCPVAGAATNVDRNGVTWDATFEGDFAALTGSTPAWSVFDVANSSESTDGNIRTHTTTAAAGANSYSVASNWSGTGGARTVEIRARVPNPDIAGVTDGQASLILGVNNIAYDFRFTDDSLLYNVGGALATVATLDTTQYHIYRVTVDQSANPIVNLYIDNNPTSVFSSSESWFTSPGFDILVYGDISTGGEAGTIDVDYISWADGVQTAVPEPASLGVLALAGVALVGRRRRQ